MNFIPTFASEFSFAGEIGFVCGIRIWVARPEPRKVFLWSLGFLAAILVPLNVGLHAQNAGALLAHILGK